MWKLGTYQFFEVLQFQKIVAAATTYMRKYGTSNGQSIREGCYEVG